MDDGAYKQLWQEGKTYFTNKLNYTKLTFAEKLSVLLSGILLGAVSLLVAAGILFYAMSALVVVLASSLQSELWAYVVVIAILAVVLLAIYAFRVKLIYDPITRRVTKLLLSPDDEQNQVKI